MSEKSKRDQAGISGALIFVVVAVSVVMMVLIVAFVSRSGNQLASSDAESDFTGVTTLDTPQPVADFTLINQDGEPTRLSDLRGKPTLLFFGFTHCPDVCPNTLMEFRQVHEAVGDQANFVFIAVDGVRDTPEAVKQRLETSKTPFVVGLTEAPDVVLKASEPFGLVVEVDKPDEAGNYNVAHTASVFVLDKEGQWVAKYAYGTTADVMIEDVQGRV